MTATVVDTFIAPPCMAAVRILYQDAQILLIDKPSGLLSLSGKKPLNHDSVHQRLVSGQLQGPFAATGNAQHTCPFPDAALIHRLDFGTSGIMVVALTKAATANLSLQFQARTVIKTYIAILDGQLDDDEGVIDLPIAKDKATFPRLRVCHHNGQPARSSYQVIERLQQPDRCRVRFTPTTGRTHQLRIHSQAIGHPILGCDLYANGHSQQRAERLLLHASDLHFDHPASGQRHYGHSPCPF
ncbi:MAG: RluA family pseudouridine synthase [Gammaproteobacteria bacterium]|nr:RluA family pseudouridine synthase [Gammaproteobacteria bacterium]